jgi:predicted transcriptional regulator
MKLFDIIFESVVDIYENPTMSQDEFIRKSQQVHKDENGNPKYTYNNVDYKNQSTKISITCPKHGDFLQAPNGHLKGKGCRLCYDEKQKLTKNEFIRRSVEFHKDENGNPKYYYDDVDYITSNTKVSITCPIHGNFEQRPFAHLKGSGCPKCDNEKQKLTKNEFIRRSVEFHKDENGNPKYTYNNVEYLSAHTKVSITCPIHGDFSQSPNSHLKGQGCPKCFHEKQKLTKNEFVLKAQKIHKDENGNPKYTYNNVEFVDSSTKVSITCPKHGDFLQNPTFHLRGNRCPRCSESKGEKTLINYFMENKIKFKPQEKFQGCFRFGEKSKRCYRLPFDFYLPERNILVEVDGTQHFNPQKFYGDDDSFTKTVTSDKLKNAFVKNNGTVNKLIRLYYNGKNFNYLISEFERLLNTESSEKILLSKDYPKAGWNK